MQGTFSICNESRYLQWPSTNRLQNPLQLFEQVWICEFWEHKDETKDILALYYKEKKCLRGHKPRDFWHETRMRAAAPGLEVRTCGLMWASQTNCND